MYPHCWLITLVILSRYGLTHALVGSITGMIKVERKRHLGNDVVMLVFREGDNEPFSPKCIRSQFNRT